MPIDVRWDNDDKRIIRLDFVGRWSWHEFYSAFDEAATMLDEVNHKVDFIADMSNSGLLPQGGRSHATQLAQGTNPKRGIVVIVRPGRGLRALGNLLLGVYREAAKDVFFASSVEEAYDIIEEHQEVRAPG